ncbi:MAG: GntR family transcriptional regulator [Pseudomonadota bacterium]
MAELAWHSRPRLVDEVAQVLRERIYAGEFAPGQSLRQVQLAQALKISRTPLREALRKLEQEGLLASDPVRGVRVVQADFGRLLEAYVVREMVDALAARLAAERAAAQAAAALRPLIAAQRAALRPWSPGRYTQANVDFHTAIIGLAGNEFLRGQMPIVRMTSQIFTPKALLQRARVDGAIAEHGAIASAIEAGRAAQAERLARAHIRSTIVGLKKLARQGQVT